MGIQLAGSVVVTVKRDDEDAVDETVSGFILEEAPDCIKPDPDDGLIYFDAIYKAYADDYAIQLEVSVNGGDAQINSIEIVDEHANVSAEISSDSLSASYNGQSGLTGTWLNA